MQVARQPVGQGFIPNIYPKFTTHLSPRWGLGNWFADVLYTYRPSGALQMGQVALDPDLSGMPDLRISGVDFYRAAEN